MSRTDPIPLSLMRQPILGYTCRLRLHPAAYTQWIPHRYQAPYRVAADQAKRALWRLSKAQLRRFLKMHGIDASDRATKYDLWIRAFLARIDALYPERELTDAEARDPRNLPYPTEE